MSILAMEWWACGPASAAEALAVSALSRSRASVIQLFGMTRGTTSPSRTIMIAPPTNSASANCQPISSHSTIPSSTTRFVEAIMNTIAAVKSAPRANRLLASADEA